ncbi:MAG: DUF4914 family protein [Candidatus Viridilinea halotolerans]|uniref:DUF4914 family protein n=1 Tax=Candidatus Viridilinea halotolerans TaxID=2491704 RepID=A0A426U876_9CHLR|nr:MAG: DUF4914 family protein [Candidatus Viridilinea halotolerans]
MEWWKYNPPLDAADVLSGSPQVTIASTIQELVDLACGGPDSHTFEVAFEVPERGMVSEVTVARVRNGVAANYLEPYMRRRDPDCMVIADDLVTNKPRFRDRFGYDFGPFRKLSLDWLKTQPLAMFGFTAGQHGMGQDSLVIAPANTGFFALGLALLQGIIPYDEIPPEFNPTAIIYVAPPFRHSHFDGKQIVVHNRRADLHEMFSYNLYPGPSAKKGIYGVLINQGEHEGWVTAHCSTVQVVTPYDNVVTIMHEGASGGGKSEMLEQIHRESDGRMLLGTNILSGERRYLEVPRLCRLRPVTDDMALCHPSIQNGDRKMRLTDAEDGWFVRVNHITRYGTDVHLEQITAQPSEPLLFLSIDAVANSRAMIWEHIQDAPGQPCPNPRVILPRRIVPNAVSGAVTVDIRSMGVRTPPCTREQPTYGIIGLFHLLPPALAWLWRLVAPRGHDNPSIVESEGMSSEGVGSYWPFATGRRVDQANLLLKQFQAHRAMRYILCPNQYVGAWKVGFMPQWIAREYLARRGNAQFAPDQIQPARCPLLGHALFQLSIEGRSIARWFLQVDTQPEVGVEAYDRGATMLFAFFRKCLAEFQDPDLDPLGHRIIECCLDGGTVQDFEALLPE